MSREIIKFFCIFRQSAVSEALRPCNAAISLDDTAGILRLAKEAAPPTHTEVLPSRCIHDIMDTSAQYYFINHAIGCIPEITCAISLRLWQNKRIRIVLFNKIMLSDVSIAAMMQTSLFEKAQPCRCFVRSNS